MARNNVKIVLLLAITCCGLLATGCSSINPSWATNVSGWVTNDLGQFVSGGNVTLWLDGKIVNASDNPQLTGTGWIGDAFDPNSAGQFTFEVSPDRNYKITCEKNGRYGETTWDPQNPIPARIFIIYPGWNSSDTNYSDPKVKFANLTESQVEEAKALALSNQSIRQMLDGVNYSIEGIAAASDRTDPLVARINYLIGSYSNETAEINSYLLACVDLTHKKIVTIRHFYGGSGLGHGENMELSPGGYRYVKIAINDVNGSRQEHDLKLSLRCRDDATVKPMILDAANFVRFSNGEPYDVLLFGNQTVSSEWSQSLTIPSNMDYYFVIVNERTDITAKVICKIDIMIRNFE